VSDLWVMVGGLEFSCLIDSFALVGFAFGSRTGLGHEGRGMTK
jgi:hypothetical protein